MRKALCLGALVAAIGGSGAALATPIGSDAAASVIDVEFWGRRQLREFDPENPTEDIISYGDPVHGKYEIWTLHAPQPTRTSYFLDYDDAVNYGRESVPDDPTPIQFVTSRWLSPLPPGFAGDVSPLPSAIAADGGFADDFVTIGDDVRFLPDEPLKDWFRIDDRYTALLSDPRGYTQNQLLLTVSTPLTDAIQGLGLDQDFELDLQAMGSSSFGRFQNMTERYVGFVYDFVVDKLHVSTRGGVCTP